MEQCGLDGHGGHVHSQLHHPPLATQQQGAARYRTLRTPARHRLHIGRRWHVDPLDLGRRQHRVGQWVFAAALQAGRQAQSLVIRQPDRHQRSQARLAHSQGARLIEGHHGHGMRQLQRLGILNQNAMLGRHPRARHDGGGRGQPQRTRAGNHQHGHRVDQRHFKALAVLRSVKPPAQQRSQRNHQHHRHKHRTHLVHQPLDGCLGGLRVFHQPDDVGQHRVHPHRMDLQHHAALAVDASAGQLGTHVFGDRQGFTGQHGFVHLRAAFQQAAVYRKTFARLHHDLVAHQHLSHGYVHLAIATQQVRRVRSQAVQRPDGGRGLALGARLQPFAQQHQCHHHRTTFKIQVGCHGQHAVGNVVQRAEHQRTQPQPHRKRPTRRRAQRHQQIHIAGARQQRMPARLVKARAKDELHRRRQQELPQRRQHPVLAQ